MTARDRAAWPALPVGRRWSVVYIEGWSWLYYEDRNGMHTRSPLRSLIPAHIARSLRHARAWARRAG